MGLKKKILDQPPAQSQSDIMKEYFQKHQCFEKPWATEITEHLENLAAILVSKLSISVKHRNLSVEVEYAIGPFKESIKGFTKSICEYYCGLSMIYLLMKVCGYTEDKSLNRNKQQVVEIPDRMNDIEQQMDRKLMIRMPDRINNMEFIVNRIVQNKGREHKIRMPDNINNIPFKVNRKFKIRMPDHINNIPFKVDQ